MQNSKVKKLKISFINTSKSNFVKTYLYKFLVLRKTNKLSNFLKNLLMPTTLILFFLEKNKLKNNYDKIHNQIFIWKLRVLHKKTQYIRNLNSLRYFNRKFFPQIASRRFLKWLFWFKHQKFMRSKLNKINYYFLKTFIFSKRRRVNWWEIYYLARDAYFSNVNLRGYNVYFLRKNILTKNFRRFFSILRFTKKFISHKLKSCYRKKHLLSFFLSKAFRKVYFNKFFLKKVLKFKRSLFNLQIKTDSFFKIFRLEFYVPFQLLFFWKSIISFTKSRYFFLPVKKLILTNFDPLMSYVNQWIGLQGNNPKNLLSYLLASKFFFKNGFGFLNTNRLEKILLPMIIFFNQFQKSFTLPVASLYVDTFFNKFFFLPWTAKKNLEKLILQLVIPMDKTPLVSQDTETNKLLTLLFYKIFSELFELIFSFSPGKINFFDSLAWTWFFKNQLPEINIHGKNWSFLQFFSLKFAYKNWIKPILNVFYKNKYIARKSYFDYLFFFRGWVAQKYWFASYKKSKKVFYFDVSAYSCKKYFPITFLWTVVYWWMFYMWSSFKSWWFSKWIIFGKSKVTYDSFMILRNKFWPLFFSRKSTFEKFLSYGFCFRAGTFDFTLDWNFLTGYKGTLAFQLWKKISFKISKKKISYEGLIQNLFSPIRDNPLFATFFTFLSRTVLLKYLVQFGHVKANFNTSFKDYLVMIYNERFILNILNIQLTLKRNLWLIFKMFYLGGFICLVGTFNILLEGLINMYGAYASQPYTRFIWVNGLFSNFDKIFASMQTRIADIYSGWTYLTWRMVKELMAVWFSAKGLLENLSIDISFFPSLYRSSWVFLESSAKFYPTISISNTECFLPTVFLEYTTVSNDYSMLTLCLYINLLLSMFKKSRITRQVEFSVYPQKLISKAFTCKILPINVNIKHYWILRQMRLAFSFFWKSGFFFFDITKRELATIFKYFFIYWKEMLFTVRKQNFWKSIFFKPQSTSYKFLFNSVAQR
jgi:hypothetical protein